MDSDLYDKFLQNEIIQASHCRQDERKSQKEGTILKIS